MRKMLDSVVGNSFIKSKLLSDIVSDSLSHAYIIEGKKGSGKHTVAYMTAAALSCERIRDVNSPLPCLECPSCKKILEKKSPDVILVKREEDKATLGVDVIRNLRNDVRVVPNELEYKVYIIEEADKMTVQAQNAFLLTLEEPPKYVKFFLLCEDSNVFLETIRSRSQILRTEAISSGDIDTFLQMNKSEAKQLRLSDPHKYNEILMAAQNSIGRAIELLDEKAFKYIAQNRALARDFLAFLTSDGGSENVVALSVRFSKKREELSEQLLTIETALRDIIALERTENAPLLFFYDREEALLLADALSIRKLMTVYDAIKETQAAISQNANVRLSIINLFSKTDII